MRCDWCDSDFEPGDEAMMVIEGRTQVSPKSDRMVLDEGTAPKYFHRQCMYEVVLHAMELDDEYLSEVGNNVREALEEEIRERIYDELTA